MAWVFLNILLSYAATTEVRSVRMEGKDFILAFCEHINKNSFPSILITNNNNNRTLASVNIKLPRMSIHNSPLKRSYVGATAIKLRQETIHVGSGRRKLGIRVTSKDNILVQGVNWGKHGTDPSVGAFTVLPLSELGREHVVMTMCMINSCIFMVVGTEKHTRVIIKFKIDKRGSISFGSKVYRSGQSLAMILDHYDTVQFQSKHDLSGTLVSSNKRIAVFSGSDYTGMSKTEGKDKVAEQMPSLDLLGNHYVLPNLPDLSKDYKIKLIPIADDTTVRFNGIRIKQELKRYHYKTFKVSSRRIYTINSNKNIMVVILLSNWGYYEKEIDLSISVLFPVNDLETAMYSGHGYKIHGIFPRLVTCIWVMLITDKNCNRQAASSVNAHDKSHYAVLGYQFHKNASREFNVAPQGRCAVFSAIQWMKGPKVGAMTPWVVHRVEVPQQHAIFFCRTSLWIPYMLLKNARTVDITQMVFNRNQSCCP